MGRIMKLKPTIGLEIHVELDTESKMFCGCANNADSEPNSNICPVCLGHPGTLPVANEKAVRQVLKTGLALNCDVNQETYFDRKNYFYPDLPKGYQISQHFVPLCENGFLKLGEKKIRIREIHLEEDTCRLIHPAGEKHSLLDCNRAGVPLMELVTEPDLTSPEEARDFAHELYLIFQYLAVSQADMEKGQMRIEANVSLGEKGKLGTKVELKNINSFKAVEAALKHEIKRQQKRIERGEEVTQQTRGWSDVEEKTVAQRSKEAAHDYRYFPEPDLPLIKIAKPYLNDLKAEVPELPHLKRERLASEFKLETKQADFLIQEREMASFFEKTISEFPPRIKRENLQELINLTYNYLTTDLKSLLKERGIGIEKSNITAENFGDLMELVFSGEISSKIAKKVLKEMFKTGADPKHVVKDKGWEKIGGKGELEKFAAEVLKEEKEAAEDFKSGKEEALQFLIGKVMQKTKGRADPEETEKILKNKLSS